MPTIKKSVSKKPVSTRQGRSGKAQKTGPAKDVSSIPGLFDVLPKESNLWKEFRHSFFSTAEIHAFYYIETALLERKSTFSFYESEFGKKVEDIAFACGKGGGIVRPELMAPLIRAYAEHHLGHFSLPLKVCMFSETLRKRGSEGVNSHEVGFHVLGDGESFYDIQVLSAAIDFLKSLKIRDISIRVNANGCRNCRIVYREKLKKYLQGEKSSFRVKDYKAMEKNPESLFSSTDAKYSELIENAPTILDYLCANCNNHFKALLELLEDNEMPYEPDPRLLFPVERWNRVVFTLSTLGEKEPLFYGGRYDHLSESVAGRQIPAVGIVSSAERLIHYLRDQGIYLRGRERPKVFFIVMGDKAKRSSVRLINILRASGIIVEEALGKQSFKAQIKMAEKSRAALVLIVGQKEAFEETVIVRNIASGAQETITIVNLTEEVKRRLKM